MEKKFNFVYITTNLINKKQYIGEHSTNNIEKDKYLGSGKLTLIPAIKKYGKENFDRKILEFFSTKKEAFDAQEKYIKKYNTLAPNGYNINLTGGLQCSSGWSDEQRKNQSKKLKGKHLSEEHKKHISEGNIGRKFSKDSKDKISNSHKGKKLSKETKDKISNSHKGKCTWMKGKHHTDEAKQKNRISKLGIKLSEEHKKNIGKAIKGEKNGMYGKYGKNNPNFGSHRKRIICEYCKKEVGSNIYKAYHGYHGNKCKFK